MESSASKGVLRTVSLAPALPHVSSASPGTHFSGITVTLFVHPASVLAEPVLKDSLRSVLLVVKDFTSLAQAALLVLTIVLNALLQAVLLALMNSS